MKSLRKEVPWPRDPGNVHLLEAHPLRAVIMVAMMTMMTMMMMLTMFMNLMVMMAMVMTFSIQHHDVRKVIVNYLNRGIIKFLFLFPNSRCALQEMF